MLDAGHHEITWNQDGGGLVSGIYIFKLEGGSRAAVRKAV
jgi:hypothetical protein